MTIKSAFLEAWKRNFGEFAPPGLMFLLDTTAAEALGKAGISGKRQLTDLQRLEDDLKLCKSRMFKLRSEMKREKFCQTWISQQIEKQRRLDEGLGSDEDRLRDDDPYEDTDEDFEDDDVENECSNAAPAPVIPPRPAQTPELTKRTPIPISRGMKNGDESDTSSDSDDYINVASLLKQTNDIGQISPRSGSPVTSRGSDTDYANDNEEDILIRHGSFGSSLEDVNITTERKLQIISNRALMHAALPMPPFPDSLPNTPTVDLSMQPSFDDQTKDQDSGKFVSKIE